MIEDTGWEDRLMQAINYHSQQPFEWGKSDCFLLMMDAAKAVTGVDPYESERGYTSESEAKERLRKRKFSNIEGAVASVYRKIPHSVAKRGDLVIIPPKQRSEVGVAGGIVMGANVIGKGESGRVIRPISPSYRYYSLRDAKAKR